MKRRTIGSGFEIGEVVKDIKKFMFSAGVLTMGYSTESNHGPYEDSGIVRGDMNPLKNSIGKIKNTKTFTIPPAKDGDEAIIKSSRNIVGAVIRSDNIVARVGIGDTIWMDDNTCIIQHVNHHNHSTPELKEFVMICRGSLNRTPDRKGII